MKWTVLLFFILLCFLLPSLSYASTYDVSLDPDILTALAVIQCESAFKPNVWGDLDKPFPSFGIAQFQRRTFLWLSAKAGRTDLKWKDPKDQMWLLIWAIKHGYGHYWTCWRHLR